MRVTRLDSRYQWKAGAEAKARQQQHGEAKRRLARLIKFETQLGILQFDAQQADQVRHARDQRRRDQQCDRQSELADTEKPQRVFDVEARHQRAADGDAGDERHQHDRERISRGTERKRNDANEKHLVTHRRKAAQEKRDQGDRVLSGPVVFRCDRLRLPDDLGGSNFVVRPLLAPRATDDQRGGGEVEQRGDCQ